MTNNLEKKRTNKPELNKANVKRFAENNPDYSEQLKIQSVKKSDKENFNKAKKNLEQTSPEFFHTILSFYEKHHPEAFL